MKNKCKNSIFNNCEHLKITQSGKQFCKYYLLNTKLLNINKCKGTWIKNGS